jgi:hypothetical protein
MKMTRTKTLLALALALAGGAAAFAQSNNVPGPQDYGRFSSFITERNIFDPNRYARYSPAGRVIRPQIRRNTPSFTLVGTMSYEKGMFAFFDGNQSNLRKVLYQSDSNSIAGFTVAEITPAGVTLQTADKKQTVEMKIGKSMRQEGNNWQLSDSGQSFAGASAGESAAPAATDGSGADAGSAAAPSPALDGNDVLKKLMQKREQELK